MWYRNGIFGIILTLFGIQIKKTSMQSKHERTEEQILNKERCLCLGGGVCEQ